MNIWMKFFRGREKRRIKILRWEEVWCILFKVVVFEVKGGGVSSKCYRIGSWDKMM